MRVRYDLHLHSCLSPCGGDDMTPNNLVAMAGLLGYDMIALTDHNTCGNVAAAVQAGKREGIVVVPGMELCTREEAHVICLFPGTQAAMAFSGYVARHSSGRKNRPEIFGHQQMMDENDTVTGEETAFLLDATDIGVNQVRSKAIEFGGTAFPAHVDRKSFSVLASLGALPPEAGFTAAEISPSGNVEDTKNANPELNGMLLLFNSDAHSLESMLEPRAWVELPELSPECLISVLNATTKTEWGLF